MSHLVQYEALVASVETGSLAKAARLMNCSPSAISKQLTALETHLGVVLLERGNRSLQLTEAGQSFYLRCKVILGSIRKAEEEVRSHGDDVAGKIALTASATLTRSPLTSLLKSFSELYPKVRFDLRMTDEIDDLLNGRIDFALRLGKLADNRLRAVPLLEVRPVFCAAPSYLESFGKPRDLAQLREHRVGLLSTLNLAPATQKVTSGEIKELAPADHYDSTNDFNTLYEMTSKGLCIAGLLDINVAADLKNGTLVQLFPGKSFPAKRLYLVYARHSLPKKLRFFKDHLKSGFAAW